MPSESIRTETPPLQPAVEKIYQAAFRPTFDRICGHSPKRLDLISTRAQVPGQVGHNMRDESCKSAGANALRPCMAILDGASLHAANVDPPATAGTHGCMHAKSCDKEHQASQHPSGHIWLVSRSHESSLAALTKTSAELSLGASQVDTVPVQQEPYPHNQQQTPAPAPAEHCSLPLPPAPPTHIREQTHKASARHMSRPSAHWIDSLDEDLTRRRNTSETFDDFAGSICPARQGDNTNAELSLQAAMPCRMPPGEA